eukprot:6176293-Pleurochrysis_carterae.AAC.4
MHGFHTCRGRANWDEPEESDGALDAVDGDVVRRRRERDAQVQEQAKRNCERGSHRCGQTNGRLTYDRQPRASGHERLRDEWIRSRQRWRVGVDELRHVHAGTAVPRVEKRRVQLPQCSGEVEDG